MIKRTSHRAPPLLLWGAALCAAIAAIPLVYLVIRIGGAGAADIWAILTRLRTWDTVATSVGLATVVVIACLLISYPTALLLTRTKLPLRRLWFTTVALPLAVPSYVAAYAWVALIPGDERLLGSGADFDHGEFSLCPVTSTYLTPIH